MAVCFNDGEDSGGERERSGARAPAHYTRAAQQEGAHCAGGERREEGLT